MGICPTSCEPRESSSCHTGYPKHHGDWRSFCPLVFVWSVMAWLQLNPQNESHFCLRFAKVFLSLLCFLYWAAFSSHRLKPMTHIHNSFSSFSNSYSLRPHSVAWQERILLHSPPILNLFSISKDLGKVGFFWGGLCTLHSTQWLDWIDLKCDSSFIIVHITLKQERGPILTSTDFQFLFMTGSAVYLAN